VSAASGSSQCSSAAFTCPLTGKISEDDCATDCSDHSMPDVDEKICIKRPAPFVSDNDSHAVLDGVGILVWFLGAGIAISVGVGGGGIFVPLGLILLRFGAKASTGLSQASIFGASLGGLLINIRSKHPKANRPLIDLDMALFLSPMEMSGALLGVIIQKILPPWAVILIMTVILGYTSVKTYRKGKDVWLKEKASKQKALITEVEKVAKPHPSKEVAVEVSEESNIPKDVTEGNHRSNPPNDAVDDNLEDIFLEEVNKDDAEESFGKTTGTTGISNTNTTTNVTVNTGSNSNSNSVSSGINVAAIEPARLSRQNLDKLDEMNKSIASPTETNNPLSNYLGGVTVSGGPGAGAVCPQDKNSNQNSSVHAKKGSYYSSEEWLAKDAAFPYKPFMYLGLLWVTLLLILLFKGGKGLESILKEHIPYCGTGYWIMQFLAFFWLFGFSVVMARRIVSKSIRKQACGKLRENQSQSAGSESRSPTAKNSSPINQNLNNRTSANGNTAAALTPKSDLEDGTTTALTQHSDLEYYGDSGPTPYPFVEGDVLWDWQKVKFYSAGTFFAGVIAGLIGIGGGMVLGPLMIQMGVLPQVAAGTTATMIVLTSSSAAFLYVSTGQVPPVYAVTFFFTAFCGALVGKTQIDAYVKRKGLASILIFILAGIIAFASVMVTVAGLLKYSDQEWCFEGTQEVCKK